MTLHCPACRAQRRPGQYLCPTCWATLPAPARRVLSRRDSRALARLRELHNQLEQGVPLGEITIST